MIILLIRLIEWIFHFYSIILLIRVLISWVSPDPYNPIVQFLYRLTDPILQPIRRLIPLRWSMIDFSPIIAFILLSVAEKLLVQFLLIFV
ncbi:MAG: YggT family protein [Chlamydiae bacterium]|nr:YggT family protein [Chlamydiota bacterium]MBI3266123.1 YggT family protein [Chlamydiota bacterium]